MSKRVKATQPQVAAQAQPQKVVNVQMQDPNQAQIPQASKRIKKEHAPDVPGGNKSHTPPPATDGPESKRARQQQQQQPRDGAASAPSPVRARTAQLARNTSSKNLKRSLGGDNIAWVLSEIRNQLETIADVEGVPDLLERFPECVLLGGIAARRELVAALLGEHAAATSAAALLVAPGMRQPLALELRCSAEDMGSFNGPEAEAWLASISKAVSQATGHRLKVDPLRLRLSVTGCASLDVVDLPEKSSQQVPNGGVHPKLEEMRLRHLGSSSNLLVCLEPGPPLDLCKRYDPHMKRTQLLGAAAQSIRGNDAPLPASMLCGPAAARSLEERFAILCHERLPQWLTGLERLEQRLTKSQAEARDVEQRESSGEVLRRARAAGTSFGRALEHVISGAPGCTAGALTLEDELCEFAVAAAKGNCGTGTILSPQDASNAVADLFANFDGVEGYAKYLREEVHVAGADVPLNGGAAWQRLLAEVEVAMRLSHPPPEELSGLMLNAVRAGGTGVHGHQRWEDVSSKLMLAIAFEPLRRRIRYVTARVVWVLKHQKAAVSEWMATLSDGPASRLYSPLFSEHLSILRQYPIVRELVFGAYNNAVSVVGEQVLKSLEGTLMAACINPEIMLRSPTAAELDPRNPANAHGAKSGKSGKPAQGGQARERVAVEMRRRNSGPSGGLPVQLRDRIFEPKEVSQTLPFVEVKLRHAFAVLANILANHAFAFADTSLATLCRRQVDEAMNKIDFSPEQSRALATRHTELQGLAQQVEDRLGAVRTCLQTLRNARPS